MAGLVGTRVPGLPLVLADIWRALNFAVAVALIVYWAGMLGSSVRGERRMPTFSAWGMAALFVFCVRALVVQAERWNMPLVWEGAPTFTLALVLCIVNAVKMRATMERLRTGQEVVGNISPRNPTAGDEHGAGPTSRRPG